LMDKDRAEMDTDAALAGLPAHLKGYGPLMKAGVGGKLTPEDMQTPEERAAAAKAAEDREIRIRQASRAPSSGAPRERKQVWVTRGGKATPIEEGTAQPGDTPYDAVATRSSQPVNPAEAEDTAREAARLAGALLNHKGLGGAFGVFDSMMPTVRQDTADAESLRDSLTSLLTLENTGKLKGVLSNTDMQILRQASSSLNPKMGDAAARAELQRIVQVMGRAGGQPSPEIATSHAPQGDATTRAMELIKKYGGGQ
jgi:hypothetical protein